MSSALLQQDENDYQEEVLYDQERFRPINIAFDPEVHKNLLLVELKGFRVHMKVNQDENALRIPKQMKEKIKNKPEDATNLELAFTPTMQKKIVWFQLLINHSSCSSLCD